MKNQTTQGDGTMKQIIVHAQKVSDYVGQFSENRRDSVSNIDANSPEDLLAVLTPLVEANRRLSQEIEDITSVLENSIGREGSQ